MEDPSPVVCDEAVDECSVCDDSVPEDECDASRVEDVVPDDASGAVQCSDEGEGSADVSAQSVLESDADIACANDDPLSSVSSKDSSDGFQSVCDTLSSSHPCVPVPETPLCTTPVTETPLDSATPKFSSELTDLLLKLALNGVSCSPVSSP